MEQTEQDSPGGNGASTGVRTEGADRGRLGAIVLIIPGHPVGDQGACVESRGSRGTVVWPRPLSADWAGGARREGAWRRGHGGGEVRPPSCAPAEPCEPRQRGRPTRAAPAAARAAGSAWGGGERRREGKGKARCGPGPPAGPAAAPPPAAPRVPPRGFVALCRERMNGG